MSLNRHHMMLLFRINFQGTFAHALGVFWILANLSTLTLYASSIHRCESHLKKIELHHKIRERWTQDNPEFTQNLCSGKQKQLREVLQKVHNTAEEYKFSKQLMKRYGSKSIVANLLISVAPQKHLLQPLHDVSFTEGVKAINRIGKILSTVSRRLTSALSQYNALPQMPGSQFPSDLTRKKVLDSDGSIWNQLSVDGEATSLPAWVKRRAIDAWHLTSRCKEELNRIHADIDRIASKIRHQKAAIIAKLEELDSLPEQRYIYGQSVILHTKLIGLSRWAALSKVLHGRDDVSVDLSELQGLDDVVFDKMLTMSTTDTEVSLGDEEDGDEITEVSMGDEEDGDEIVKVSIGDEGDIDEIMYEDND